MIQGVASGTPLELASRRRRGIQVVSPGGVSSTYATAVLATAGLVSFYRLNEPSGTTMTDAKGANTGSYVGTPTLGVAGPTTDSATAITIPNADGSYGLAKTSAILAGLTNWSVEAFVNTAATPGANSNCIYCERNAGAGNDILKMELSTTGNKLGLTYRDDAGTLNSTGSTATINSGTWRHVAITKSGTTIVFYIDGAASGGTTLTATNTFTNVLRCQIGDDPVGATTPFNGSIADVALYNVAVPAGTISAHFAAK